MCRCRTRSISCARASPLATTSNVRSAPAAWRGFIWRWSSTLAELKRPYLFGRHSMWRARIRALLDEREVAVGLVREALSHGYPHTHRLHAELDFEALRDYPPFQELLRPKE